MAKKVDNKIKSNYFTNEETDDPEITLHRELGKYATKLGFINDKNVDGWIGKSGLVYDAFKVEENELLDLLEYIEGINKEHPEYDFLLTKEKFPIGFKDLGYKKADLVYSNYVLYLTNFRNVLDIYNNYYDKRFNRWSINRSSNLEGAISINATISGSSDTKYIKDLVSDEFNKDIDNDIWFNDNGAVLDCFTIYNDVEMNVLVNKLEGIISNPGYDIDIKEGVFPIELDSKGEVIYSTHVSYIKNYKELLNNNKIKKLDE